MVSIEKSVIARYKREKENFEILVDPELALEFKTSGKGEIEKILAAQEVYKDSAKGDRASPLRLKEVFGTEDVKEVAKQIILKGEVQLTTEQKRKMTEERRKQIVSHIARLAVNPQTGLPHPPLRIEQALEQTRFHTDPFKSANEQIESAMKLLRPLLPIKFEMRTIALRVPPEYSHKVYNLMRAYTVKKEEWQNDGSLIVLVEIPAGIQDEFYSEINKITKGNVQTKLV